MHIDDNLVNVKFAVNNAWQDSIQINSFLPNKEGL